MLKDSQVLNLFRAVLTGDDIAWGVFCDALEDNDHPLQSFAREIAAATPTIPADLNAETGPATLACGNGWRIEHRPGRVSTRIYPDMHYSQGGENAEVGAVYEAGGPCPDFEGVSTDMAPAGVRAQTPTERSIQENVTAVWVQLAFETVRLNMIGNLLVGHGVVILSRRDAVIRPALPAIDHRIQYLLNNGL